MENGFVSLCRWSLVNSRPQVAEPYALLYNPPFAGKVNI